MRELNPVDACSSFGEALLPAAARPLLRPDRVERVTLANAKARERAASIQLVFDGDSIVDGWQGEGRSIWEARYVPLDAFDFAIAGDRTQHLLGRLCQGQVDHIHPKLIVLLIGTNNLGHEESIADTIAGVTAIVAEYRKRCPRAVILLHGIFPRGERSIDPYRLKIKSVNEEIAKLAETGKVIYVDLGYKFLQQDGTMNAEIMPDFLHPSVKGYEVWADALQPYIDRYF